MLWFAFLEGQRKLLAGTSHSNNSSLSFTSPVLLAGYGGCLGMQESSKPRLDPGKSSLGKAQLDERYEQLW